MDSQIQQHRDQIASLCRRYAVSRLAVFGSALRSDFDPSRSDLDFLVEFSPLPASVRVEHYFGLLEELTRLFARKVDLVEDGAIRNPYILKNLNEQQQTLYAA